jgi:hypothetical protein
MPLLQYTWTSQVTLVPNQDHRESCNLICNRYHLQGQTTDIANKLMSLHPDKVNNNAPTPQLP